MVTENKDYNHLNVKKEIIQKLTFKIKACSSIFKISVENGILENIPFIFETISLCLERKNKQECAFDIIDNLITRLFQHASMYQKEEVSSLTLITFIKKLNILDNNDLEKLKNGLISSPTSQCLIYKK